jgi:hypothetical protein
VGVSPEVATRVCALGSACQVDGSAGRFGTCHDQVELFAGIDPSRLGTDEKLDIALLDCYEAATDCATLQACLTAPTGADAVCVGGASGRCSGGWVVDCGVKVGGQTQGGDCAAAGLACVEGASTGTAACVVASCDPQTTKPTCSGDKVLTCDQDAGGVLREHACWVDAPITCPAGTTTNCQSHIGETCGVVNGTATCVGTGSACDETSFQNRCDGNVAVTCTGGQTSRFDCSALSSSLTCKIQQNGTAACDYAGGTECDAMTPESCANGVISYCAMGKKATADCKAYGLSGCAQNPTVAGAPATARCTP